MNKKQYRNVQNALLLLTTIVISYSFYFEYVKDLQPCPLCLMQRLSAFVFGLFCLVGLSVSLLYRARIIVLFQMLFAAAGLFFSARQMWLQSLPVDQGSVCVPGLDMMMRYFSWNSVLKALFWGTSDCGEVSWKFMGLSMPVLSALYFVTLLIVCCVVFISIQRLLMNLNNSTGVKRFEST